MCKCKTFGRGAVLLILLSNGMVITISQHNNCCVETQWFYLLMSWIHKAMSPGKIYLFCLPCILTCRFTAEQPRGPTQIRLPDLNYIWHGTFRNLPKPTAKISRSYFYFLMIYGCHSQTHNLFFIYIKVTCGCRSDLFQAVERNIFFIRRVSGWCRFRFR
jgi:hypothetical protein